jgi:prepilin-type N-terminal cleavage/methylation domain-containing protein
MRHSCAQGFTLIEVLVSLLLSAIAILCLCALQVKDRQWLTDSVIQNEATLQVFNIRELVLSEASFNSEQLFELTTLEPDFKPEMTSPAAHQILIRNSWRQHGQSETEKIHNVKLLIET